MHEIRMIKEEEKEEENVEALHRSPNRGRGRFRRRGGRFIRRSTQPTFPTSNLPGRCYNCNKERHFARECKTKPRNPRTGRYRKRNMNEIAEEEEDEENEEDRKK